jgi:pimeloyl-ACP methyl ester carboxylesterase/DNA-binding CsgD family transcriptional regulator
MEPTGQRLRFCTAPDGVRIAYALTGDGPPLVKAANWLSHLEFDWVSPVWRHWLLELSRDNTLIRYDERGNGLSDREVEDLGFEAWVSDLETVVDARGLERFPLVGMSQGGAVALTYAVRHPERVSQLILYGAFARGWRMRDTTPQQKREYETLVSLMQVGWGSNNPVFRDVFANLMMPDATPEQARWFVELQHASASPEEAVRLRQTAYAIDVVELARQVRVPTLILHGRADAAVPIAEGKYLAELIPGARFVELESKNHVLVENEPAWTRFLSEVRSFIGCEKQRIASQPDAPFAHLTTRERDVLELLAQGLDNTTIAARLSISEKTVRNHVSTIFDKLQLKNRSQAIVRAREAGFGANTLTHSS